MSDRRRTQKNHIRAARDWLGEAEHSLEHENDIQGDLKLMLARAELSQVKDSPRLVWLKRWGMRLLPLVAAVLLVLLGAFVMMDPISDGQGQERSQPVSADVPAETPENPVASSAQESAVALPASEESQPDREETMVTAPVETEQRAAEQPSVTAPSTSELPKGQLPDAQKQRLMQSAGKILRQQ